MPITRQPYFLPTQITGCSLWLDSADLSSFTLSGSSVTQWRDKSGSNNNATPYSTSPQRVGNSVLFSGGHTLKCGAFLTTTDCSVFIVNNYISTSGVIAFGCWKVQYGSLVIFQDGSIRAGVNNTSAYNVDASTSIGSYTSNRIYGLTLNSSTTPGSSFTFNGSIDGTNVTITGTSTLGNAATCAQEVAIGGIMENGVSYYNLNGYVYEVVVYNVALTSTQRQQVESYLAQKWNLTASLPTGHPGLQKIIYRNLQTTFTKKQYFTAFSPKQIAGCSHWFDATDSSTITLSSGSLTQWNDKSGNGRNLTAVSGYANATVSSAFQNGLNVFNFSGNGLYRTAANTAVYPQDVYIVVALKSTTTHVDVIGVGATNTGNFNSLTFGEYSASRWHNGSSYFDRTPNCVSSTTETSTSFLLIQWSIANNNFLIRRNGTQLVQTATYTYTLPAGSIFQIGYRHPDNNGVNFSGYIGEIVVFNNQIGTTDRQNIESYLAQKWGLVSSLAAGHLNETFPAGSPTAIQPYVTSVKTALTGNFKLTFTGSVSSGLLSYFSFNSHVLDFKNTIILSVTGSIPYVNGQYGKAIYLANETNSANGSTATNYLTSAYNVTVPFSVSLWFNPTNTNRGSLFSSYNSTGVTAYGVNLYIQGGGMSAAYNNIQSVGASYSISTGTWYYAVITVNSSNGLTLFVNGSQVGSTITQTPSINGLMIGNVQDGGGSYAFSGYLDDYRLYNRVLSGGEISAIYAGTG